MITYPLQCKTHKCDMNMIPCPDKKPGCLVAHFGCPECKKEQKKKADEQEQTDWIEQWRDAGTP